VPATATTGPLVTALIPVRTYHAEFLRRALDSVFGQTSPRWRLLVIDDRADSGLADVIGSAVEDPRVALVASDRPGLAAALNTGMRVAATDFVAILLGDDMWTPDAVAVLTAHIERNPQVDFFHSGRVFVDADDRPLSSCYEAPASFTLDDFISKSPVKHLLCWRRDLALAIGGLDETIANVAPDDWDFPWSMAEHGATFMSVPGCLYLHRDHREGFRLTTHLPRSRHVRELRRMLRKHGVGRFRTEREILAAKRGYLRQCLYRNSLDRWLKQKLGFDPRRGWREPYE
jgi:glycosyltransferase involved in cell wall biosynthesis